PSLPPAARSDQTPPTAIHTLSLHDALPISEITDNSFAFFYQFYSSLIHLVKIIRSKIKPVFPVSSQPFHICFDGIHKLCLLFGRVGVVKTEVKLSVIFLCQSVI